MDQTSYTVNTVHQLPTELQPAHVATRKTDDVVAFFTGATPLSNFYKSDIELDSRSFSSVEQYYQYRKALYAEQPAKAQKILENTLPLNCKRIGDSIMAGDGWLQEGEKAMYHACKAKFTQNTYARQFLLATGERTLAEASTDLIWGSGKRLNDQDTTNRHAWTGQNRLGKVLMKIRNEI